MKHRHRRNPRQHAAALTESQHPQPLLPRPPQTGTTTVQLPWLPLRAVLCGVALLPGAALAQSAERENTLGEVKVIEKGAADDYAPAVSTIGGKTPAALRDIPQSVTVINQAVIKAQGNTSLTEALRNVPGITLSAGEGGAIGDSINLRGFSARTDLFIDGMRDRGQYTRDTFFLDAVEVLKGPSSMLFGRGSTGGVINQLSKKAQLKPISEVGVTVGTNDFKRATLDLGRPLSDTAALRAAAFYQESESDRDVVHGMRSGAAASLRLGLNTPTQISFTGLIQHSKEIPDYGFPFLRTGSNTVGSLRKPIDAPTNSYYGYTDDHFDQDVGVFGATIQHKITPDLTMRNQLQYSKYRTNASPSPLSAPTVVPGSPAGTTLLSGTPLQFLEAVRQERDRLIDDESLYNQTDLIAKFATGPLAHTLSTGIEIGADYYARDDFAMTTTVAQSQVNLGNPVNGTRQGNRSLEQTTNVDATSVAAYVNDQVDIGKQWKLVGGVRYDRFKAKSVVSTVATAANVTLYQNDGMTSYRGGVIYQPTDAQSYYVSYGTSFNPSAETVTLSAAQAGVPPERNRSIEIGAKWDLLEGDLALNTALFRLEKTNARTTDPVTGDVTIDGKTRVDGYEISATGRITQAWNMIAGYTYLDGKVIESDDVGTGLDLGIRQEGHVLQNTPKHSATLWTTYLIGDAWEVGGGLVYSDKRFVNNFETAVVDGYTRYDATIAYRQKHYDVRLNLQNLSDETYFDVASGGRATLAQGRAAKLSVTYRF